MITSGIIATGVALIGIATFFNIKCDVPKKIEDAEKRAKDKRRKEWEEFNAEHNSRP